MNFTFNQLKVYGAVVVKLPVIKAADELNLTQPAVPFN